MLVFVLVSKRTLTWRNFYYLAKISGSVVTERRIGVSNAHTAPVASARKLEEATDVFAHKTVDKNLAKAITQARMAKKLTQAQLATAINERPQVIQQYESGAAIPNPSIINKLDRALGIHLPRK
jgi:putative transcription factor